MKGGIIIGTQFTEIYAINELLKNDNRLQGKTQNQIYELYYLYLKYGIGLFKWDCKKVNGNDLGNRIDFLQKEYHYISDNLDNQYLLSPAPPIDCSFYVGYRVNDEDGYIEINDTSYSYNSTTNIITIDTTILTDNQIYISGYIIGSFNDILDEYAIDILSQAMLVPWSQEKLMTNSLLNNMVYGGSSKMYSQSPHIKELKDVTNNQYFNIVKGMISDYSYKANSNNSRGLGGGLV